MIPFASKIITRLRLVTYKEQTGANKQMECMVDSHDVFPSQSRNHQDRYLDYCACRPRCLEEQQDENERQYLCFVCLLVFFVQF